MKIKFNRRMIVFAVIVVIIVGITVALVAMDLRKASTRDLAFLKQEYLNKIMQMQNMQKQEKVQKKITFEDAKKDMPKAEKIDFKP